MRGRHFELIERLNLQLAEMKAQRLPYDYIWEKVAVFESEHMTTFSRIPARADYMALRRDSKDIDNTARHAITVFSSGMLSGVSPPSDQWFSLRVADESGGADLQRWKPVAEWIEQLEQVFANDFIMKNFYTQQVSSYKHIGLYGMQCMYVGDADDTGTYYKDVPVDEIYIADDYTGRVNCVFREMEITLQQAIQLFGVENMATEWQQQVRNKNCNMMERLKVVHAVYKKDPGYENYLGRNVLPWVSYYFEPTNEHLITEGGFSSLPYIVTRAYSNGRSPYSVSPGTVALADVLMINEMKKLILQAGQLSIAPPMLMPDRGLVGRINYMPSAINTYRKDSTTSVEDFRPLTMMTGNFQLGLDLLAKAQEDINTAFFVDLFLMIHNRTVANKGTPTATEIQQLATEKSFLLAPILINQQQENFNRLFERVFELKSKRAGAIPPMPEEMRDAGIDIHYISPLVRAQQSVKTNQILQALNDLQFLVPFYPEIIDNLDADSITRKLMEFRGMPQSCIKTVEEVQLSRQQRQEQQQAALQQQQEQQQAQGLMQGYSALTQAPQPGSPADLLMQGGVPNVVEQASMGVL